MHHTLVALVEDKPGVLERVASQFRRRAFNIESLTVGRTAPGISCMTIVVDSDKTSVDKVVAALNKLINVLQIEDLGDRGALERDMVLVKVASSNGNGDAIRRVVEGGQGRIVAKGDRTMTIEITGEPSQIDGVLRQLEEIGIVEMARSGPVALARGDDTINQQ